MAELVPDAQQEFWRSPIAPEPMAEAVFSASSDSIITVCPGCGSEFMIDARYCHACGMRRAVMPTADNSMAVESAARMINMAKDWAGDAAAFASKLSLPRWLRYLHFHEIQRMVGLSTASLIAFLIGLGCVAGALGVSLFYKAASLAEFQAIQMWRLEWLMAATAAFVAGILLKKPQGD